MKALGLDPNTLIPEHILKELSKFKKQTASHLLPPKKKKNLNKSFTAKTLQTQKQQRKSIFGFANNRKCNFCDKSSQIVLHTLKNLIMMASKVQDFI